MRGIRIAACVLALLIPAVVTSSASAAIGTTDLNTLSPANVARVTRLARGADVFFCEAPFLEEDLEQATRRYHLTAAQAGALARAAAVRRLQVFHFSPRYEGRYGEIIAEAQAEFAGRDVRYGELERGRASLP